MSPFLLGIIAHVGWAVGDIFAGLSSRKIGSLKTSFLVAVCGFLIFSPLLYFYFDNLKLLTLELFFLTLFLSIFAISGNVILNQGMKTGYPSIVGTIGASFVALTIVLNSIFFENFVSKVQWIAIIIIFSGVLVLGINTGGEKVNKIKLKKSILFGVLCCLFWAIYFTWIKIVMDQLGWFVPMYITTFTAVVSLFFVSKPGEIISEGLTFKTFYLILFCAILLRSADFILNWSIKNDFISIVGPIAGAYPTLFVVLSFFVFKEKLGKFQITGIVLGLTGICILSFFG